jgi:hypothetical protein
VLKKFRLDPSGLLRLKIAQIENPNVEPEWVSSADHLDNLPTLNDISHLSIPLQGRILRLSSYLSAPRPGSGPWCARGIIAASSQGCTGLSLSLIDSWFSKHWSTVQEARARAVTRIYFQRLKSGVIQCREISPGILDCSDIPAPIIPSIIRYRNWLRKSKDWVVLSGGDHLSNGYWVWYFDEYGVGTILQKKVARNRLTELYDEIGIHLNHPRVERIDGHLHCAR